MPCEALSLKQSCDECGSNRLTKSAWEEGSELVITYACADCRWRESVCSPMGDRLAAFERFISDPAHISHQPPRARTEIDPGADADTKG